MDSTNIRMALLAASYLLEYPDACWLESLEELQEEIENIKEKDCFEALSEFIEYSRSSDELNMAELYTKTFEFAKETTLYMTYYTFKEKQERGTALLNLKNRYLQRGLNLAENELPDFLPVILEYTAATGDRNVLDAYTPELQSIYSSLRKENNPYSLVLQAILITAGKAEGSKASRVSVEYITQGGASL